MESLLKMKIKNLQRYGFQDNKWYVKYWNYELYIDLENTFTPPKDTDVNISLINHINELNKNKY